MNPVAGHSQRGVAIRERTEDTESLMPLDQEQIAEQVPVGEDESLPKSQTSLMVGESRVIAVPQPTWHWYWALVSEINQRFGLYSRTPIRRNENEQPARNAMSSRTWRGWFAFMVFGLQPASPSGSGNTVPTAPRTVNLPTDHYCVICQDPVCDVEFRTPCGHYYDIGCITNLVRSATRDETLYPPRCCRQNIPLAQVQIHLPQDLLVALQEKEVEFNTLHRVYCSSHTCDQFLGPLSKGTVYTCPAPNCGRQTCGECRSRHTDNRNHVCLPDEDADTTQVLELALASGWARCPGCLHMIELNMGCYHMTCRCRTQFCYLCLAQWKTCQCPQWDEVRLLAAAEERLDAYFEMEDIPIAIQTRTNSNSSASSSEVPQSPVSLRSTETRWPSPERVRYVREITERLRMGHGCDHPVWRYRDGGGNCQYCGDYSPKYLFRCQGCEMSVCGLCRYNRL